LRTLSPLYLRSSCFSSLYWIGLTFPEPKETTFPFFTRNKFCMRRARRGVSSLYIHLPILVPFLKKDGLSKDLIILFFSIFFTIFFIFCLRSEEHTSELQSRENLVCRLLLEKKKKIINKD